jgi:hypothetical protein
MMGMEIGDNYAFSAGEGWQVISLSYKGGLTGMVIIVADAENF